jgi:competence protein ComEC
MTPGYEVRPDGWWQPFGDGAAVIVASAAVIGAWQGSVAVAVVALAAALIVRRVDLALVVLVVGLVASALSDRAWRAVEPDVLGPYRGWATVVGDPAPAGRATGAVVEIDGERFRVRVYGADRHRLARLHDGEQVHLVGDRVALTGRYPRMAQVRHVVGEFRVESFGESAGAAPLRRASNRVRDALRAGAERTMTADQAALFTGLVIGDDTRQSDAQVDEFRAGGLSHLMAVSGQNVAFVLALAGLGLRRLPRWWRLAATLAVIGWFVVLTRAEPSVVRAGAMAAWTATAFAMGREHSPLRVLSLAVTALVLIDPLLVWSVGFWLSVGATAGVCVIGPGLAARLAGPRWLIEPLAVTMGAQVGVLLPSVLVFGRLPVLGPLANMLAVPVAGFVMLYGIPAALVAAATPDPLAEVIMLPCEAGTRWISTVAALAARLAPTGVVAVLVGVAQACVLVALLQARWRDPAAAVRR